MTLRERIREFRRRAVADAMGEIKGTLAKNRADRQRTEERDLELEDAIAVYAPYVAWQARAGAFIPYLHGAIIVRSDIRRLIPMVAALYLAQEGRCAYCDVHLTDEFHVDHRLPIARGGTDDPANLCCACQRCNLAKHTKTPEEFLVSEAFLRIRAEASR